MAQLTRDWGPLFETIPQGIAVVDEEGRFVDANRYASRILEMKPLDFLAVDLRDSKWKLIGPDGDRVRPEAYPIQQALRTRQPIRQRILGLLEGDSDEILWLEISVGLLPEGGAVFTFRDISDRFRRESMLSARARVMACATGGDLEKTLCAALDEAERLTGSSMGFFHRVETASDLHLLALSTRTSQEFCTFPSETHQTLSQADLWTNCLREGRPIIHNAYASLPDGLCLNHAPIQRILVVPILMEGRPAAILSVGNKPFDYGSRDVETVLQLANLGWESTARLRGCR